MIERHLDQKDGIIFVRGTGVWTRDEIDVHYEELRALIAGVRAQGKPVRVLIDVTAAERQRPVMEAYVKTQIDRTYRAGDRVAMLVASGEDKQHVRSIVGTWLGTFTSRMAAEMWLMEEGLAPPT